MIVHNIHIHEIPTPSSWVALSGALSHISTSDCTFGSRSTIRPMSTWSAVVELYETKIDSILKGLLAIENKEASKLHACSNLPTFWPYKSSGYR
jgi:hypothetical protein